MADREKVIRGLECCAAVNCGADCPYSTVGGCRVKVLEGAITLLREQEPVEPKTDGTSIYDVDGLIVCGKCGGSLGMPEIFKFCPWCGRAVKWDE